jgi:hypothetical protein
MKLVDVQKSTNVGSFTSQSISQTILDRRTAPTRAVIIVFRHSHCLDSKRPHFFSLALQPPWALASAFQFHDHFTDRRTPWMSDQLVARPLPKHRTTQTQNKHIHTHQTSIPCVGFEPTIPASERAKTVHALERSVTVTGKGPHIYANCKLAVLDLWTNGRRGGGWQRKSSGTGKDFSTLRL